MRQLRIPAAFYRGGTSNAVVFHASDLPADRALWPEIFLAALGSPDPNGRQLDGMGGGISSLSKVCVIGPPSRADADIDYSFFQIGVKDTTVDDSGNCGNMSSAMGPFAVDEGLVTVPPGQAEALVRIHNTNTKKIIWSRFPMDEGQAGVDGAMAVPGVSGTGAPVRLEFREPGGASTGKLLPTGRAVDTLDVPGVGRVRVSCIDAANACAFVRAEEVGLDGTEMPTALDTMTELLAKLEAIRCAASVAMGIAADVEAARKKPSIPKLGIVTVPKAAKTLSGEPIPVSEIDVTGRMISIGQPHRALPLTGALCMAVAARVPGSIVHEANASRDNPEADVRIGMPSGILVLAASVTVQAGGALHAEQAAVYRTARRLFDGQVYCRASRVPGVVGQGQGQRKAAE